MSKRISLQGETHEHQCGYKAYCGGRVLDSCRPPTEKERQAIKLLSELGWRLEDSSSKFCEERADANGVVKVQACSSCEGHYYS